MPLLKPLPGDLADRQTILELKINHANVEMDEEHVDPFSDSKTPYGKKITTVTQSSSTTMGISRTLVNKGAIDTTPFLDELDLVRKEIESKWVQDLIVRNKVEEYDSLYDRLAETNATLWDLEDKIRALKAAPSSYEKEIDWLNAVKNTAFDIVSNNDTRAVLIKGINALWGYNRQEKMY